MKKWRLLFMSWLGFGLSLVYLCQHPFYWIAHLNSYIMGAVAVNVFFWRMGVYKWVMQDFQLDNESLKKLLDELKQRDTEMKK